MSGIANPELSPNPNNQSAPTEGYHPQHTFAGSDSTGSELPKPDGSPENPPNGDAKEAMEKQQNPENFRDDSAQTLRNAPDYKGDNVTNSDMKGGEKSIYNSPDALRNAPEYKERGSPNDAASTDHLRDASRNLSTDDANYQQANRTVSNEGVDKASDKPGSIAQNLTPADANYERSNGTMSKEGTDRTPARSSEVDQNLTPADANYERANGTMSKEGVDKAPTKHSDTATSPDANLSATRESFKGDGGSFGGGGSSSSWDATSSPTGRDTKMPNSDQTESVTARQLAREVSHDLNHAQSLNQVPIRELALVRQNEFTPERNGNHESNHMDMGRDSNSAQALSQAPEYKSVPTRQDSESIPPSAKTSADKESGKVSQRGTNEAYKGNDVLSNVGAKGQVQPLDSHASESRIPGGKEIIFSDTPLTAVRGESKSGSLGKNDGHKTADTKTNAPDPKGVASKPDTTPPQEKGEFESGPIGQDNGNKAADIRTSTNDQQGHVPNTDHTVPAHQESDTMSGPVVSNTSTIDPMNRENLHRHNGVQPEESKPPVAETKNDTNSIGKADHEKNGVKVIGPGFSTTAQGDKINTAKTNEGAVEYKIFKTPNWINDFKSKDGTLTIEGVKSEATAGIKSDKDGTKIELRLAGQLGKMEWRPQLPGDTKCTVSVVPLSIKAGLEGGVGKSGGKINVTGELSIAKGEAECTTKVLGQDMGFSCWVGVKLNGKDITSSKLTLAGCTPVLK